MRPVLSRKEIQRRVIDGLDKSFDTSTNLTLYLRACERLLRESHSAQAEEDNEQAYFILLRLVELIVNYIPRHPQAKDPTHAARLRRINKMAPSLMVELDTMKTKLDADYERYKQSQRSQLEIQAKLDTELRAKRQRSEVESVQRAKAQESASAQKASRISPQDIQKRLQALHINSNTSTAAQGSSPHHSTTYDYPELAFTKTSRPSLPNSPISFSLPRRLTETPPSVVDRPGSTAPASEHYFTSSASLENDYPLKTIFLPSSLQSTFLSLASSNTARNLETCGILSGTLRNNAYFVTTLIVPAQESTSDTCHTTDEEGLFNYQDANDLFTLGWIHTHPTQTCFLSSVDLHTQCGYQLMLPESIAIVLAPSKTPSAGTFRLTDPPGLHTIKTCTRGGLFHPHDEGGGTMYVGADRASAGHVKEVEGMTFTVEDQRL